jgi:lysophospholipase L1-like esterase
VYDGNPVFNGADNNANNVIGNQVEKVLRSKDDGNTNYADFDMIFIAAGTNDSDPTGNLEDAFYANDAVVGVESVDRTTWQGAFRYCVEKLQGAYHNAKIFICTPIQAVEAKRSYASIKAKGDYLKKLSARMSVNCIDTMLCGICGLYEVNDASGRDLRDGLHTNDSGALKIAKYNAMMVMNYYAPEILEDSGEDEAGRCEK